MDARVYGRGLDSACLQLRDLQCSVEAQLAQGCQVEGGLRRHGYGYGR